MAETSFPFISGAGTAVTEALWRSLAGRYLPSGVIGALLRDANDTSLKPALTAGAGPSFSLTSGEALISGHKYDNSSTLTKTTTNNGSGNPRVDRLVLRLDTSARVITAEILTGTAGISPSPPSTAPTGSYIYLPIARATVAGGGSSYSNLVDERVYTGVRHIAGLSTGSGATMQPGDQWYQKDTNSLLIHDGSGVVAIGPSLLGGAVTVTGTENSVGSTSGTSYTATVTSGVVPPSAVFVMPPSGKVTIHFSTAGFNTGGNASTDNKTSMQVRQVGTPGSGTVVMGVTDADMDNYMILYTGTATYRQSSFVQFSGTPGATYNARMLHRVGGGTPGTGSWLFRFMKVVPDLA